MNRAGRVLFIVGIFIALVSGAGVFLLLLISQPKPSEVPTTTLVMAFQEIPSRSEVSASQIGIASWPRAVPTPTGAFENPDDVVGKLSLVPIYPGQPILQKMVIDKSDLKDAHSDAALLLEKGSVAIAMQVSVKTNVAEAVQAGDRVDVVATFRAQATSAVAATAVSTQRLLADVLVMEVGPWTKAKESGVAYTIITFQIKEQDALVLEYALLHAENVTLVLRAANDREVVPLEPVTFDYINQRFGFKLPR